MWSHSRCCLSCVGARARCMYERDDATEPPQPPLDHSFFRLSVGLKKDESDTPKVAWTPRLYDNYEGFQKKKIEENWNNGLKSAWLPELTVTRGIRFMFHNRPRCLGWKKYPHSHKDADLKENYRVIGLFKPEENRNTYVIWTKPFRFVFAQEKRWDSSDLKIQPRHR